MITIIRYFFLFLFLVGLQIFVFDNIFLFSVARPVIFFFFLLAIPKIPDWQLMIIAFFTGLFYDVFYYTPGIYASACVLTAFMKMPLLKVFKEEEEGVDAVAHITYLGFARFLFYITFVSFIFQLTVSVLTVFSFREFGNTLLRASIASVLSIALIYIFDIIFFYRRGEA